jgi:Flp pilus assembly protein TadG
MRTVVKLAHEEKAQGLLVMALFMGLVGLGFLAFALDVGSLFRAKRSAQAAADAAAVAAAKEVEVGNTSSNEQAIANAVAKLNGFDPSASSNPATVSLSTPSSGNFTGSIYVQATVTKSVPTAFLGGLPGNRTSVPVSATAIAGGGTNPVCVCIEGSAQALFMVNGSTLNANNCGIVDDSNSSNAVTVEGSSTINASSLGTVSSTWNNSGNINNGGSISSSTTIVQGLTSTCQPTMPTPPSYSGCVADPGGGSSNFTAGPASAGGTVCYNGLTIGANGTTPTLNPGIYVIASGTLHFKSGNNTVSNLGGQGVFFYLTGSAALTIDNGANVNLVSGGATESGGGTAQSLGAYNGILVYQASGNSAQMNIAGGSSLYMNGALYAPSGQMIFSNGTGSNIQGGIVCTQLIMTGGSVLNTNANVNQGTTIVSPRLVQ